MRFFPLCVTVLAAGIVAGVSVSRGCMLHQLSESVVWSYADKQPLMGSVEFTVLPQYAEAGLEYLLFVGDGGAGAARLNGVALEMEPTLSSRGLFFHVPKGVIVSGKNLLEINGFSSVMEAELFSVPGAAASGGEWLRKGRLFPEDSQRAQPPKHSSQYDFDILHVDLDHTVPAVNSTYFEAVTTITAEATADNLQVVALDFNTGRNGANITVNSVDNGGESATRLGWAADIDNEWLLVTLPAPVKTGDEFTVRVDYAGTPSAESIAYGAPYVSASYAGENLIRTFSQPYGARNWWPSKDLPDDKFTIDIRLTVPSGYTGVSNGALVSTEDLGGQTRYNWSESYPVASYLVSIAVADYEYRGGTYTGLSDTVAMDVGHYLLPFSVGTYDDSYQGTLNAVEFFSRTFGEYPFLTEKYVTTENDYSGMEHQTATSMRTSGLADGGNNWLNIHELAHQWFGDQVTIEDYTHIWLNEGFATYLEALYYEEIYGRAYYHTYVNNWATRADDSPAIVNPNADQFTYDLVYLKAGFVLHMLRHVMGDEVFFAACRHYLNAHSYGTVLTQDFEDACEAEYGLQLDWFFDQWIFGTGRPSYSYTWLPGANTSGNTVELTIDQNQGGNPFTMPIDIHVTSLNGTKTVHTVYNDSSPQQFTLEVGESPALSVEFDPENYVMKSLSTAQTVAVPTVTTVLTDVGTGTATVAWTADTAGLEGFQLYRSDDGMSWGLFAGTDLLDTSTFSHTFAINPGEDVYVLLRAVSASGTVSPPSDIYATSRRDVASRVLIIDGLDRVFTDRPETHAWAARHAKSLATSGVAFDTVANEAVIDGTVLLGDYEAVFWVMGEESSPTNQLTFDSTEQSLTQGYLNGGGSLFVTGAEIGWDLVERNHGVPFYNNYLKSDYIVDDSGIYTVVGVNGSIFEGLTIPFDDGSGDSYFADYPDVLESMSGSTKTLNYEGTSNGAGIQYAGTFPDGTVPGRLVYIGFGFETIQDPAIRDEVMRRVVEYFGLASAVYPEAWVLY